MRKWLQIADKICNLLYEMYFVKKKEKKKEHKHDK